MTVHVVRIQILQEEIGKLESSMRTTADLVSGIGKISILQTYTSRPQ